MSKIVVTGGAGYVGLPLCAALQARGHEVVVIDIGISGEQRLEALQRHARVLKVDITSPAACRAAILEASPQIVVHLAALHFIPECNRRPVDAVRINVLGTQSVLDACLGVKGLSRLLVTSSAAVYPPTDAYCRETDSPGPTDIYGITKATNEWQAAQFAERSGVRTTAVRLFNVFGPGETNAHVIPVIIDQLRAGQRRLALGNTSPKRSYVYVDDVVSGFEAIMNATLPSTFSVLNLGNEEEASVDDLLAMMSSALGESLTVEQSAERTRQSDRPFLRCNIDAIKAATAWTPRCGIEEGVRKLLVHEGLMC